MFQAKVSDLIEVNVEVLSIICRVNVKKINAMKPYLKVTSSGCHNRLHGAEFFLRS
jgi:hypothetical protein